MSNCAFDHAGMKVVVRNYEISGLKIRFGRFLFSHEGIKEQLKSGLPDGLVKNLEHIIIAVKCQSDVHYG